MGGFKKFYNLFSLQKRFVAVIVGIAILFVALICRLGFLQLIRGDNLQLLASEQWFRDLPLKAKRGDIYDTNGVMLANCETTYDIYVRARSVKEPEKVAKLMQELLSCDYDLIYQKATNVSISESLIKLSVPAEIALKIIEAKLDGIYMSQSIARNYTFGELLTQVLGYTTIDNIGQAGIEAYYDKFLCGVNGKTMVQADAKGKELKDSLAYYLPSIAGADISLTIDSKMQIILENALKKAYIEHKAKYTNGIIIDAETGHILAMSVKPSFDLNEIPRDNIALLNSMTKNSAVVDVYEPGSTFKIFTIAAALNENLTTLDDRFFCGGSCSVDGQKIKCWKTKGHGSQNLVEGFKNSCNCVFVNLALRLGVEKMYEYLEKFHVCQKTGVDIASETSGILLDKSTVTNNDLARIGFGHSVALSPLNMITSVANVVTNSVVKPQLLKSISVNNKLLYQNSSTKSVGYVSNETQKMLLSLLKTNINGLEGKLTFIPGYDIGGKTGTAQKYENSVVAVGKYISSFVGVYPTSNPKYVLMVCVDEPSSGVYYGSMVAAPIGKEVFSQIFSYKNISPDDITQASLLPDVIMPELIGKSLAVAGAELKKLGLFYETDGEGDFVVGQLPISGTQLFAGETVLVKTN